MVGIKNCTESIPHQKYNDGSEITLNWPIYFERLRPQTNHAAQPHLLSPAAG